MKTKLLLLICCCCLNNTVLYSNTLLNKKIEKSIVFINYISAKKIYFGLSDKFNLLLVKHFDEKLGAIKSESQLILSEEEKELLNKYIDLVHKPYQKHFEWAMEYEGRNYLKAFGYLTEIEKLARNIKADNEEVKNFNYLVFMMEPLTGHIISEYPFEKLDKIFSNSLDIVIPQLTPKSLLCILLSLSRSWGGISFRTLKYNVESYIEKHKDTLKDAEISLFKKILDGKALDDKDYEIIKKVLGE